MDKIVVRTTHLLANSASPPYFDANMDQVMPCENVKPIVEGNIIIRC